MVHWSESYKSPRFPKNIFIHIYKNLYDDLFPLHHFSRHFLSALSSSFSIYRNFYCIYVFSILALFSFVLVIVLAKFSIIFPRRYNILWYYTQVAELWVVILNLVSCPRRFHVDIKRVTYLHRFSMPNCKKGLNFYVWRLRRVVTE